MNKNEMKYKNKHIFWVTLNIIVLLFFTTACCLTILAYARNINKELKTNSAYVYCTSDSCSCNVFGDNPTHLDFCRDLIQKGLIGFPEVK